MFRFISFHLDLFRFVLIVFFIFVSICIVLSLSFRFVSFRTLQGPPQKSIYMYSNDHFCLEIERSLILFKERLLNLILWEKFSIQFCINSFVQRTRYARIRFFISLIFPYHFGQDKNIHWQICLRSGRCDHLITRSGYILYLNMSSATKFISR